MIGRTVRTMATRDSESLRTNRGIAFIDHPSPAYNAAQQHWKIYTYYSVITKFTAILSFIFSGDEHYAMG